MAIIRVPVVLNKGRIGIPLRKLGSIVKETETFLKMLAEDIELPGNKKEWLGIDFRNGSLAFNAEYVEQVEVPEAVLFATSFENVCKGHGNQSIRANTRHQYVKIAEQLDQDEVVEFGIYKDLENPEPKILSLSKRDIPTIIGEIQGPVESVGGIQGIIHSIFMGSSPRHFFVRELSTGELIKCIYVDTQHPKIAEALREEGMVIHVYGLIKTNIVNRKIDQIVMQNIDISHKMSNEDFNAFFGSCPDFTGQLNTQEFIDWARRRNDEGKAIH